MTPRSVLIAVLIVWLASPVAAAQDFCDDLRKILAAAPSEFANLVGAPLDDVSSPSLTVFLGTQPLSGSGRCSIAQQTVNKKRFSTSLYLRECWLR